MMTEISLKYLKQNKSYITFSEDTHLFWLFLIIQKTEGGLTKSDITFVLF